MNERPTTLQEAILFFSEPKNCIAYMTDLRWPDGIVVCPTCGRKDVSWLEKQQKWQCKSRHTQRQFSPKTGTIFEDSPLPLDKWLMACWMLANCKNGVSSYEIAANIGVTQKSAWFMMHRIRHAMSESNRGSNTLGGGHAEVEADETYIGGKLKNMHAKRRMERGPGDGGVGKAIVMGALDRLSGEVRAEVIQASEATHMLPMIQKNVEKGTLMYTDEHRVYNALPSMDYVHEAVAHYKEYVRGRVHTNSIENFWSCLKRGISGTYIAVEPFHLDRYVDEQVFRFNARKQKPAQRFDKVLSQLVQKRLTFSSLIGKEAKTAGIPF